MTTFPRSPRLMKGALIGLDQLSPLASLIVFQYNPDTMTRRLDARSTGSNESGDKSEAFRLSGPPRETITLTVELDATDQLEKAEVLAVNAGVYPALSALEMLLYPKSEKVIADTALALAGNIEIIPPEAPLTVFVWGVRRVLPVRLTGFSITEEEFDTALNPIRAKADLNLQVLSYADLKLSNPGYSMFLAHQIAKEALATSNVSNSIRNMQNISLPIPRL
jgi:Contractile injection system tube protein